MDFLNLRFLILIFAVMANTLLALLVYKNNPKSATNRIFGGLSVITTLWLIDIYLSVTPQYIQQSLLWVRLSIFLAAPQILLFFLFSHTLPRDRIQLRKRWLYSLVLVTLVVMADAISPLAFTAVNIKGSHVEAIPGAGLALFVLFAICLSVGAVYVLFKKLRRGIGYEKEQYRYVISGLALMLGLLTATVLIPVALFKNNKFVALAPLYTVAFLGCTTYAIVRKRLFDVRPVVARSIAYILSLGFIAGVISLLIFGFSGVIFAGHYSRNVQQILYAAATVVLVFSYPPIKRFFDHFTNRLFYKDAYDPQSILDELSSLLVAEIDLQKVLGTTRSILSTAVKSSYVEFVLFEGDEPRLELSSNRLLRTDIKTLANRMRQERKDIIIAEELSAHHTLREPFAEDEIAVSLRLKTQKQVVGYILFGDKKSGEIYNSQDIRLLTIVANELAIAIQNSLRFEEIQRFNITLQQKIDEATRELKRVNHRLRELDKTKDEFISMASHQLRTPLTTVKGYLSMVLDGDTGPVKKNQKEMVSKAFSGAQRMVYLIGDMLNVSRLQTGKFVIENHPTNLDDLVEGEVSQLQETAAARNLKLIYHKPAKLPIMNLDETKIRQVVMNFIDNAIFYTRSGGSVTVELTTSGEEVQFTVTDTGIGIPAAVQHHLFSKFYRADNARKLRPDGTGLGLFMTKKVIMAQGGVIIFKSVEGKGSTFGFSFPRHTTEVKGQKTLEKSAS